MKRSMAFVSIVVLMAAVAGGAALAAGQSQPKVAIQDLVAVDPGTGDNPTPEFCAGQGCSCTGAGCRCTDSSGSYCSNSSDGQTCTSGPCAAGGGFGGKGFVNLQQQDDDWP